MTATSRDDLERRAFESGATMRTSEVLYRAADLIEKRGWVGLSAQIRGEFRADPWGRADGAPVCLEGAIVAAAGLEWNYESNLCPAGLAVFEYLDFRESNLFIWNDAPERTAAEVIEVLRAAAVIEAAKERSAADARAADAAIHPEAVR